MRQVGVEHDGTGAMFIFIAAYITVHAIVVNKARTFVIRKFMHGMLIVYETRSQISPNTQR